jgi:hypothetical protein
MMVRLIAVALAAWLIGCGTTRAEVIEDQADILSYQLDRLESRVGDPRQRTIQRRQTETDLRITQQWLRTLKTRDPGGEDVPVLERRLDRLQRDAMPRNPLLRSPSRHPVVR